MHSSCPVSCKSATSRSKSWSRTTPTAAIGGSVGIERQAQHKILVAFVDSAKKEDLDDVEEMIKNRRAELEAEAEEEEESELHQEL